jgi:hypothetical protein
MPHLHSRQHLCRPTPQHRHTPGTRGASDVCKFKLDVRQLLLHRQLRPEHALRPQHPLQ